MISVAEINTFDELANVRLTWRELWEKTPGATFVQSWDWMRSYWRHYGNDQGLRALLVTLRTKPIGIVPLVSMTVETRVGSVPLLTWPTNHLTPFYGVIGPNPAATLNTAFKHVCNSRRHWKAFELPQVDEFGTDNCRTRTALRNARLRPLRNGAVIHPAVELCGSWDWFMESRDLKSRVEFVQAEKYVSHFGPVSFHRWRPTGGKVGQTDRRWDLFRMMELVRRNSGAKVRHSDRDFALLKDVHPAAVDAGAVDFCSLSISGRPAACAYSYRSGTRLENVYLGVRQEFGDSALTCLLSHMLRDSIMRDDERVIFQPQDTKRVQTWSNTTETSISYGHYAKLSPGAQLLRRRRNSQLDSVPPEQEPVKTPALSNTAADMESETTPELKIYSNVEASVKA